MKPTPPLWTGAAPALASAVLFGASTPLAKLLLGDGLDAGLLAGLLYLGSGLGLTAFMLSRKLAGAAIAKRRCAAPTCPGLAWSCCSAACWDRCF